MVKSLFNKVEGAGKQFGDVALNKDQKGAGFGRLLQSPENESVYPDDEDYAISWIHKRHEVLQNVIN